MKDLTQEDYLNGQVLLIDKPLEWSSFQAVNKLKWAIRKKFSLKKFKIGHAGTLDPLATGLLIICTGKFTKKITEYQGQEKEYAGIFTLGGTTASYDLETEINETFATDHITPDLIKTTTHQFIGDIDQAPPVFSALKKDGKRLYELAREGKTVDIPKRKVNVSAFDITAIDGLNIHFRIACSKGTYIRSIAHDFGAVLNSGAHLTALRRTKIGDFNVDNAQDPLVFADLLLGAEEK
ncbi:tRNA pseudouridine(55) synthase TruB [Maribacter sp. BPC-D8]|uniref:tRNA pseudouridine(55) synthase TruB n=1 Tax=Maribacter sp. BPC-D8 TaxID=3053613 RepID=UPI002B49DD79|nr:tRNA pseudouridine(55) synthase TruB [Maribacter sp. BPC-D8]WRI29102.1 tRNA pseudouridine(55) synthase TruB [Maribacter sp. BPC-D8]